MQLPLRVGATERVTPIEAIGIIDAQWPERRHGAETDAGTPEEPRGIEVPWARPEIARIVEHVDVHRLIEPQTDLGRAHEEGAAERFPLGVEGPGRRGEAIRRDRELGIAAQGLAELHPAQGELLRPEELPRVTEHRPGPRGEAEGEPQRLAPRLRPPEAPDDGVVPEFGGVALVGRRPAERAAVEGGAERLELSLGRERHVEARVAADVDSHRAPDTSRALVGGDRSEEPIRAEAHPLQSVGDEDAREPAPREGEADAQRPARPRGPPEIGDPEARLRAVRVHLPGDEGAADLRIHIRRVEVVDELPVLPLQRPTLAFAEKVRLLEPDEATEPDSLPDRGAEVHVPGPLLLHPEDDVDIPFLVGGAHVREREGRLEETEVRDAPPAPDHPLLVEHIPRDDHQLVADAVLDGEVVAEDVDAIDDRRGPLLDIPPQADIARAIGGIPFDHRTHLRVDVSLVAVEGADLLRRLIPARPVEDVGGGGPAPNEPLHPLREGGLPRREGIPGRDLLGREAPIPHDLERLHPILRPLLHLELEERLAPSPVDLEGVIRDLEIHMPAVGEELRDLLPEVGGVGVLVELAAPEEEEPFGLGLHHADHLTVLHEGVPAHVDTGDGEAAALIHAQGELHPVPDHRGLRGDPGEIEPIRLIQRVDPAHRVREGGGIDRPPHEELHPILDLPLGEPLGPRDIDRLQQGALGHREHDDRPVRDRQVTGDGDGLEVPGRIQVAQHALDGGEVQRLPGPDPTRREDRLPRDPPRPTHRDRVGGEAATGEFGGILSL